MVSTLFRDFRVRSSTLVMLGTLQPQAFGSLNHIETLDSASKLHLGGKGQLMINRISPTHKSVQQIHGEHSKLSSCHT